jgi:uncharacterized protein YegL
MKSRSVLLASAVTLGLTFGCSAGSTGNAGGSGGATSSSSGDTTSTTAQGFGGNTPTGSGGGPPACVAQTAQTQLVPLDMLIVLDESGSMSGTKWDTVTMALKTFINDPASAGISVGFVYFPNNNADDCNYLDYAVLNSGFSLLPGGAQSLVDSINGEMPHGGTPTWGALKGALSRAVAHQDLHQDHKVVVIFASDGDPTSCSVLDIPSIAQLSQQAYNYNGVQTFAVAMPGATLANLNAIAAAGGTMQAYDVTNNVSQFSQKMQDIRQQALPCQFVIPPPPDGKTLDPNLVNVEYTPGGMGMATKIPKAAGFADCGSGAGWYYDNEAAPTKILLCPASCAQVKNDSQAKVDVAFGCKSIAN